MLDEEGKRGRGRRRTVSHVFTARNVASNEVFWAHRAEKAPRQPLMGIKCFQFLYHYLTKGEKHVLHREKLGVDREVIAFVDANSMKRASQGYIIHEYKGPSRFCSFPGNGWIQSNAPSIPVRARYSTRLLGHDSHLWDTKAKPPTSIQVPQAPVHRASFATHLAHS